MLPRTLLKDFDLGRLKRLLALFFLTLAIPTVALIWQAYSQLKWESFHQYRGAAEELTARIDKKLIDIISAADQRSFADYAFLVVTGDPSANFIQRSPLSAYPVNDALPGVIGYFQVGAAGEFSTPLLPPPGSDAASLGITPIELAERRQLSAAIIAVLADNQLVRTRPEPGADSELAPPAATPEVVNEEEAQEGLYFDSRVRQRSAEPAAPREVIAAPATGEIVLQLNGAASSNSMVGDKDSSIGSEDAKAKASVDRLEAYSQQVFDQLGERVAKVPLPARNTAATEMADDITTDSELALRKNSIGKVSELKLDEDLQRKSEVAERFELNSPAATDGRDDAPARSKRREQTALPESAAPAEQAASLQTDMPTDLRVSTFESELDPFEFSLLDSGHCVIFRKVWRDGERFIQGLLLEKNAFVQSAIESNFIDTALFDMSSMLIAYRDDVIYTASRIDTVEPMSYPAEMSGALLYRSRLTAPFDSLELIFTIKGLPAGPGASVLGWVTLVLAVVFVGGFITLYRLGRSQIQLARQQQDFVSAVSHELKTPLTSIRMYGEMLKEGWADEDKRQSYYEFIHDEAERLSRMIANVLQLAKITRNEPQFDLQARNVGELLSNIESKISNQVDSAGFKLVVTRDDKATQATLNIDEDCFAQIVINLVDNAIKFSKNATDKAIDISCAVSRGDSVVFSIRDYGPGIPRDQLKKIFGLFYRSESELTRETVGTGIGLAIVRELTLAMSGSLDVVNRQPGVEFRVSFPTVS
jgi:signal transduction histidine kinase